ncbi:MAG TPA: WD40 repeat domain-containing serine/threonine-protein kinase [Pirellulales bacterium]|jgi:WD40 repeat protein
MTRIDSNRAADPSIDPLGSSLSDALASGDGSESYALMIWLTRLRQERVMGRANAVDLNLETTRRIGHFELESLLGSGAYGAVFRALDTRLGRRVALKVAWPGVLMDPVLSKRFVKEPKTVALLSHPGIVEVYETGNLELAWFMVLELIDGPTLEQWLAKQQRVPPPVAASMMRDVALAVDYAHSHGVVHRDLKPSNVLLRPSVGADESVLMPVVTDFGLAHWPANGEASALTATCVVLGTDHYMSPEQAAGQNSEVGPASDVFSLGVILYEMINGRRPFDGKTSEEVRGQIRESEPESLRRRVNNVPRDLETVVFKCLEKSPGDRYASASALAADLGRFLRGEPIHARPASILQRAVKFAWRRPAFAALAGTIVCGLLLLSLVAGAWLSDRQSATARISAAETAKVVAEDTERQRAYVASIQRAAEAHRNGKRRELIEHLERSQQLSEAMSRNGIEGRWLRAAVHEDLHTLAVSEDSVRSVRFSPRDSILVSVEVDGRIAIWDTATWTLQREMRRGGYFITSEAEFSVDGSLLAIGFGDGRVVVYRMDDHVILFDERVLDGRVRALAWVGESRRLAVGGDGAKVWIVDLDSAERRATETLETPSPGYPALLNVSSLEYVAERGALLACGPPGDVYWIDVESCRHTRTAGQGGSGMARHLPIAPGHVVDKRSAEKSSSLYIYQIDDVKRQLDISCTDVPNAIRFCQKSGTLAVGLRDGVVEILELGALAPDRQMARRRTLGHSGRVNSLDFSPDGQLLASAGSDGQVRIWPAGNAHSHDIPFLEPVRFTSFSPCGQWFVALDGPVRGSGRVTMFDARTFTQLWQIESELHTHLYPDYFFRDGALPLAFTPDGQEIALYEGNSTIRTRAPSDGRVIKEYPQLLGSLPMIRYSPDGKTMLAYRSLRELRLVDHNARAITGELLADSLDERRSLHGMFRTKHGDLWLDMDSDRACALRATFDGPPLFILRGVTEAICTACASSDGRYIAVGADDRVAYVWDLDDIGPPIKCVGHTGAVVDLCFAPDSTTILSHSMDNTVRFWDLRTGAELLCIGDEQIRVVSMALIPSGETLVLGIEQNGRYGLRIHRLEAARPAKSVLSTISTP